MTPEERVKLALDIAYRSGGVDGDHHKAWVIDQMVRALTGCPFKDVGEGYMVAAKESAEYRRWVKERKAGEDGPETYSWDVGIPP